MHVREHTKIYRVDKKGRITLGALAEGISSFAVTETKDHKLILEPYIEVPIRSKAYQLSNLLAKVTSENIHAVQMDDNAQGNEEW